METITETTVGLLSGKRVGVGNIDEEGTYTLPDGSHVTGTTAMLFFADEPARPSLEVGAGSVVSIGSGQWRVVIVEGADTDNTGGKVTFELVK